MLHYSRFVGALVGLPPGAECDTAVPEVAEGVVGYVVVLARAAHTEGVEAVEAHLCEGVAGYRGVGGVGGKDPMTIAAVEGAVGNTETVASQRLDHSAADGGELAIGNNGLSMESVDIYKVAVVAAGVAYKGYAAQVQTVQAGGGNG